MNIKNFGIIIPARINSSRFPGKVLQKINGISMIERIWTNCIRNFDRSNVWVATDSKKVLSHIEDIGGNALLISGDCQTGMDRVAEANKKLNFEYVVNCQGDEPILEDKIISQAINFYKKQGPDVLSCMSKIRLDSEFADTNIIKVAVNSNNDLLYMSRASIPLGKDQNKLLVKSFRQVCIYILNKKSLSFYGEGKKKSSLESIEDIEMLRLLDHNLKISMLEVDTSSIAVDVPNDIQRVQNYLNES